MLSDVQTTRQKMIWSTMEYPRHSDMHHLSQIYYSLNTQFLHKTENLPSSQHNNIDK